MPYRSDDAPCPECGTPLGQIPFKRNCREHKLHEAEYEEEERNQSEHTWSISDWGERYEIDPKRAFVELAEYMTSL